MAPPSLLTTSYQREYKSWDLTLRHLNPWLPKNYLDLIFPPCWLLKVCIMKSKTMQAWSNNFSLNVRLKWSFASRPCDTVRYRFLTWACWTPIFHQTHRIWHISLKLRESLIAAGWPIIFFRLTCCWLTWNCSEPEQNMKGAVLTVRRCCRPRHCFWCVNPVTLMPKHFSSSDTAQRVKAALNARDWLAMFD